MSEHPTLLECLQTMKQQPGNQGIKTKGFQVWDIEPLLKSHQLDAYLDFPVVIEEGHWSYDEVEYVAKIYVSDPAGKEKSFTLYVVK